MDDKKLLVPELKDISEKDDAEPKDADVLHTTPEDVIETQS